MRIEAFAKVNLTLEVLGVREDGYHALRSLVVPVSLSDTLEVEATSDGTISSDSPYPDDLCIKAAKALRAAVGPLGRSLGARISVEKRIPAGGGLGGGSADAAATLRALNGLWGLDLPRTALLEVAAQVGSDVPALVLGGAVVMEGRGEKVVPFGEMPRLDIVLVNPGVFSSTKEVYANCRSRVTDEAEILYNMRTLLQMGNLAAIGEAMVNDLAEPAMELHPEIGEAMEALKTCGAECVSMTGSGSTVFGLVPNEARGREIAALLAAKGYKAWSVNTDVR